jgi:DNA primase
LSLSQDIESRIQILDIVNRYVQTKKAWVNYKWLCPFHQEKSPSFVISPQKNIAHCFSCGKWGGPINFLMEIEKIEFREAIAILAKEAGVELKTDYKKERAERGGDIYGLYRDATLWYNQALLLPENQRSLDYLLHRGISMETIRAFSLGYSHSPRDLLFALREKWYEPKFMIDSGLFVSESRDKFFGRIVFPIANSMGHTVAFTGRVLDDSLPKYLNSPASAIFDKSAILYGFHLAKQSIAKQGYAYIVEGQMDTIALHQAWVTEAVGISGTALTKDHIRVLRRFATTIYLALDSDNAGVKATFASIENLLGEDLDIRIITIPNGKDPDEYTKSWGDFSSLRETSLSVVDFYLLEGKREYDMDTIIGRKKLIEKCLEIITRIGSQIEVDFYLQEISAKLSVSMEILYAEYKKSRLKTMNANYAQKKNTTSWTEDTPPATVYSPSLCDLVAGYIYRYWFLDLFLSEFRYTSADLTPLDWSVLMTHLLADTLDPQDQESLSILDLRLEEDHLNANPELITRAFRDILRTLHRVLISIEKEKRLEGISPDSNEYLQIYTDILTREKQMGLRS